MDSKTKPGRAWRTLLVISLALNLLVLGAFAGLIISGDGPRPPRHFDLGVGPVARALAPDERATVRRTLRRDDAGRRQQRPQPIAEILGALRADPFDPVVLDGILARQDARTASLQSQARAATVDVIVAMTPDRRQAFADDIAARLQSRDR